MGGGWAVGEGNLEFRIQNSELKKNKMLLARVLESTKSGQLRFYQDDKLIGQINTRNDGTNVRWFEVGKLVSNGELVIHSEGDLNVVNALAILDESEWQLYKNRAQQSERMGKIVEFKDIFMRETSASVTFKQLNPTKYEVEIKNIKEPAFLVFSESYDPFWKISGISSLPVYSLLNGFMIDKDGKYIVEFEGQKYVYPGLVISGVTLIILIFLLLSHKYHKLRL